MIQLRGMRQAPPSTATKSWIPNVCITFGCWLLAGWLLAAGCWLAGWLAVCWLLAGLLQAEGCLLLAGWLQADGCYLMAAGYWQLAAGWLLAPGCWLAAGCWQMALNCYTIVVGKPWDATHVRNGGRGPDYAPDKPPTIPLK